MAHQKEDTYSPGYRFVGSSGLAGGGGGGGNGFTIGNAGETTISVDPGIALYGTEEEESESDDKSESDDEPDYDYED